MSHLRSFFRNPKGLALAVAGLLMVASFRGHAVAVAVQDGPFPLTLEGGTGWLNTAGPIRAQDLRGKIVVLDFWTYCCINCHHVLPDLAYLEEKYKNDIVVIGIHKPKFTAEKDTENLRKKVAEYKIKHPVINDANDVLWNAYGVESWPTLGIFDVKGNLVQAFAGEGHRAEMDAVIGELVSRAKAAGTLDTRPFLVRPESEKAHDSPLNYPGKVLADAASKRLFISDTANNRIVVSDLKGKLIETIGTGQPGKEDGGFDRATFNRPQGMCLVEDILYVADTESHALRAVNLKARKVETIAGTGKQADRKPKGSPAKTTPLSSPWDVVALPGGTNLIIAMAGTHQLWKIDLKADTLDVWAGSSHEDIKDGFGLNAAFAQPSGLATDGKHLYVADSEGSCIRSIILSGPDTHKVSTVVGEHDMRGVLFSYGDVDGEGREVRLQHCLGLAYHDGKIYVADTYNNKIKVCDPIKKTIHAFLGTRDAGNLNEPAQFDEPGGLSVAGTTLFVADTNNHAIRAIDLTTRKVSTLAIAGLTPPPPPRPAPKFSRATVTNLPTTKVAPAGQVELDVSIAIPAGYKLNSDSPVIYLVEATEGGNLLGSEVPASGATLDPPRSSFTVKVPLSKTPSEGETLNLKFSMSIFTCKNGSAGFCTVASYVWNVPITFAEGGAKSIPLAK